MGFALCLRGCLFLQQPCDKLIYILPGALKHPSHLRPTHVLHYPTDGLRIRKAVSEHLHRGNDLPTLETATAVPHDKLVHQTCVVTLVFGAAV